MASGSFLIGTTNQYVEGRCYWDAWADPNRNVSRINVSVYFYRTNIGYKTEGTFTFMLYSSFGEQARNTQHFSFVNPSGGNGTQVLSTSWDQPHDNNGNLSFRISVGKDSDVFSLNNNGGDIVADRIARQSTVASQPMATLPDNVWIDLNVNNSNFRHDVTLFALNTSGSRVEIEKQTGVGSRATFNISSRPDLKKKLAETLAMRDSMPIFATAQTYDSNGTKVGDLQGGPVGAYYRPALGFIGCPTVYVNETIRGRVGNYDSRLTYDVYVCIHLTYNDPDKNPPPPVGNAAFSRKFIPTSEAIDFSFSASDQDEIAIKTMPDRTSRIVTFQVDTKCEGVLLNNNTQIPAYSNGGISIAKMAINPVFNGPFTVVDTNTKTTGITENSAVLIQGQSTAQVTVLNANRAVAQKGATIKRYDVTINGVTVQVSNPAAGSNIVANFGAVNAATNTSCTVTAVDSRDMTAPLSNAITVIPYSYPTATGAALRKNNFEASTKVSMLGSFSLLPVGGQSKNDITLKNFRKRSLGGAWDASYTNFATFTKGTGTYEAYSDNVVFDVDKIYEIEMQVQDKLSPVIKLSFILNKGTPIAFMDSKTQSLGVNMVPVAGNDENKLQVQGSAYVSDNVKTQVILFPKTGAENKPDAANTQYTSFRMKDDRVMMNDKVIFSQIGITSDIRLGGNLYANSVGGIYFDQYGNMKSQSGVHSGSTWSIYDSKDAPIITIPLWDQVANGRVQLNIGGMLLAFNKSSGAISLSKADGTPASLYAGDVWYNKLIQR